MPVRLASQVSSVAACVKAAFEGSLPKLLLLEIEVDYAAGRFFRGSTRRAFLDKYQGNRKRLKFDHAFDYHKHIPTGDRHRIPSS